MRRSAFGLLLLTIVAFGSGCGGDDSGGGAFRSITLQQTGGIAGINRSVTVQPNGEASTGKEMADADLDRLRQLVEQAEGTDIQPTYVPEGLCCDQFHYALTIDLGGRTITTATADGAAGPKVVEDIIGLLIALLPTG